MSAASSNRRETLGRAVLAAGTIAAAGLLRPVAAVAQATEDEDLRDFLAEAIALEQITVLAYATALEAGSVDAHTKTVYQRLRDQEQAHAAALRTALDSLGFDPSDPPDNPKDSAVFDGADGIDDEQAAELGDLLARVGNPKNRAEFLALLLDLERRQIGYYLAGAPGLDSEDLATTSAEIAADQAQHMIVLEGAAGTKPVEALVTVEEAVGGAGSGK